MDRNRSILKLDCRSQLIIGRVARSIQLSSRRCPGAEKHPEKLGSNPQIDRTLGMTARSVF